MKDKKHSNTLANIIKKKIRKRIYIALSMVLLIPIFVLIYSFYTTITVFKDDVNLELKNLADNIMGQYLVNNTEAINLNILSFNKSHSDYRVVWESPQNESTVTPAFHYGLSNFEVVYPIINKIGGEEISAGTLTANGSITLLIGKKIIIVLIFLCVIICIFSFILYLLLLPLVNDIPSTLILKPIQSLFNMMNNESQSIENIITDKQNYEEIRQIGKMVSKLIITVKQQEKNAAFIMIARKIIHDIKSPLQMALSCNQKILSNNFDINLSKKIGKALRNIHEQLSQMHGDIEGKNFLATEKSNFPCYILIKQYVQNIIVDKELELNYKISLILDNRLSPDTWCFIDPYNFINNISNLINNAYEALPNKFEDGTIIVKLLSDKDNANKLIIEIEDDGIGIDTSIMDKVVTGYTTKAKGSGLGLSSAIKFFQSEGRSISIHSIPNVGTVVKIGMLKCDAPKWFTMEPEIKDYIVILDDNYEVHAYLQSVLYLVTEVKYFTKIEQFTQWYQQNHSFIQEVTYFIDNKIECSGQMGVDLIDSYKINQHAYLMTDEYDNGLLQQKVSRLNIKMLPKQLLQYYF